MSLPRRALRAGRALSRGVLLLCWTLIAFAVQRVMLALPGRGKIRFARFYWSLVCSVLGVRVRTVGDLEGLRTLAGRRPVLFVSNHSSWIDIAVLGGRLEAAFIAKREVGTWPLIGTLARLGRTSFVSRDPAFAAREGIELGRRLRDGDDLILFPEGTSSDGSRVLPFRSGFFTVAKPIGTRSGVPTPLDAIPIIQPVSLVYDRLAGMPVGRSGRPIFAWFGDMDIASHFWRFAQWRDARATVLLHEPIDPAGFASRKDLAAACWSVIAEGADALRQNRRADPLPARRPAETSVRSGRAGKQTAVAA